MADLIILLGAALLALASALAFILLWIHRRQHEAVLLRVRELVPLEAAPHGRAAAPEQGKARQWLHERLSRAGIAPARWQFGLVGGGAFVCLLLGALWQGIAGALLLPALLLVSLHAFLAWRIDRRRTQMIDQLPVFVDHLIRAINVGHTIDGAFSSAVSEAKEPLHGALERVVREMQLGGSLDEALDQAARLYDLRDLRVLTLALRVNRRYGSGVQGMLKSLITMLRQGESARRELKALTGETRMSAWVLGLLPVGLAFYISLTSPGYLQTMWQDPSGRIILLVALGFQALGGAILWRMMRSL